MNTRVLSRLSIALVGIALCLHQATAQQETATPAEEVVSPIDSDTNEKTTDSAMHENDELSDEVVPDESETLSPAEEAFQSAVQHKKDNELDEAIVDCTEASRLDPQNLEYRITCAELHGAARNYDRALQDAAKILEADPNNLRARLLRGKMLELSGDTEKALSELNAAIERNPTSSQALLARRYFFDRQGQHEKALADGQRIMQLEPNPGAGYLSQAVSHGAAREPDQAMNYASALIQQNPQNALAYSARAAAWAEQDNYDRAMEDAETAVKLAPDNPIVHYIRGCMHLVVGEYDKSLADLQQAADLQPGNYEWKVGLAEFLAICPDDRLRNGAKASQLANEALKFGPNNQLVWRAMGAAAAENGDFEAAIKWQQRVIDSPGITGALKQDHQKRLEAYKAHKPYRHKLWRADPSSNSVTPSATPTQPEK